jgi:hypothetical protein
VQGHKEKSKFFKQCDQWYQHGHQEAPGRRHNSSLLPLRFELLEQMIARFSRDGGVTARRWLLAQVRHVGWKDTLEAWPLH